jgi:menaquinone-dependent protoporphyrinogen oxidase
MRVLVTASGRYGSTQEIADVVGRILRGHGHDVDVVPAPEVEDTAGYDAVVMGGAVYAGQWLRDGRQLIERIGDTLPSMPLWVFSSGPVGDDMDLVPPPLMHEVIDPLKPREHVVFAGKLERAQLFIGDKAIAQSLSAQDGDYRDWEAIGIWAEKVATEMDT